MRIRASNLHLNSLWLAITGCDEAIVEAERDAMSVNGSERASEIAQEVLVAAHVARRSAIVAYLKASGCDVAASATDRDLVAAAIRLEVERRGGRRAA